MSLLQMSLSGAAMILAVLLVRALALHRLPKRLFPALCHISRPKVCISDPPAGTIFPARAVQCVLAFEPPRAGCGTPARASNSAPLPFRLGGRSHRNAYCCGRRCRKR